MSKKRPTGRIETGNERAKIVRGVGVVAGRKASVPLYVMVEPEQMERYKEASDGSAMSMREWVTIALDSQYSRFKEAQGAWKQIVNDEVARVSEPVAPELLVDALRKSLGAQEDSALNVEQRLRRLELAIARLEASARHD